MNKTNLATSYVVGRLNVCTGIPIRVLEDMFDTDLVVEKWYRRIYNKTIKRIRSLRSVKRLSSQYMEKYKGYVEVNYVPKEYPQLKTYR